jgi:hypothetical protein
MCAEGKVQETVTLILEGAAAEDVDDCGEMQWALVNMRERACVVRP